jgi:hypothetical protein
MKEMREVAPIAIDEKIMEKIGNIYDRIDVVESALQHINSDIKVSQKTLIMQVNRILHDKN